MKEKLLILGCAQAKRHDAGEMPALERYDGPVYRMIRKMKREGWYPENVYTLILSAKFGLIDECDRIPDYDLRMTPEIARRFQGPVKFYIELMLRKQFCDGVFINLGKDYRIALETTEGLESATWAQGGIGSKMQQMREWLLRQRDVSAYPHIGHAGTVVGISRHVGDPS